MNFYSLTEPATDSNFNEEAYLAANPDVARAVKEAHHLSSGRQHFEVFGKAEGRCIRLSDSVIVIPKLNKMERIRPLLRQDMPCDERPGKLFDFLNKDLRVLYNISTTDAISSNAYEHETETLINELSEGLVLDCGSGRRDVYYENVVNFEIVDYDTTDVVGVGEMLPFIDNAFDAVISLSVLEHVKNPFKCAQEIARVLKPGGRLICTVPFLQPYHGYPHHYYNMTAQGLSNLFEGSLEIDDVAVTERTSPVWGVTWILRNWAMGLDAQTREEFLQLKIADLIETGDKYLDKAYVKELPQRLNTELAYAHTLFAHKK